MKKEIDIDRKKFLTYTAWSSLWTCGVLLPLCGLGLLMAAISLPLLLWYQPRWLAALRYYTDDRSLRVEVGLLFRRRKTIPFDKITDMELVQGPLMRTFGLWNIKIQTASTGSQIPKAMVVGVITPEKVREEILTARDKHFANAIKPKEFIL